jgi:hypothetical protein
MPAGQADEPPAGMASKYVQKHLTRGKPIGGRSSC